MDQLEKYLFQPKKFSEILDEAVIVVDTNVLLAAYQYRDITFKVLLETLNSLNKDERLLIPSHVLKEFFKNRPGRIVEIIQSVQQLRDNIPEVKKPSNIESKIPSLEFLNSHSSLIEKQTKMFGLHMEYKESLTNYRKELDELIVELKAFFNDDPVLNAYGEIFKKAFFKPDSLKSEKEMLALFKDRVKADIPPGNKDASKGVNSEGDYIIWEHILRINTKDVIFISADNKNDWVHKDSNGKVINARRELVEEFYEASNGKTFCIVHPSKFIQSYNPKVEPEIITDLQEKLVEDSDEIHFSKIDFSNYINNYNPQTNEDVKGAFSSLDWSPNIKKYMEYQKNLNEKEGSLNYLIFQQSLKSLKEKKPNLALVYEFQASLIEKNDSLSSEEKEEAFRSLAIWIALENNKE